MMLDRLIEAVRGRPVRRAPMSEGAAEPALVRHVERAAAAFGAPIALVTLLRDDEQSMLAAVGMPFRCMPRQEGFCRYAVERRDLFEVCDAATDPRFAHLPVVREDPGIRYYLGAPFGPTSAGDVGAL